MKRDNKIQLKVGDFVHYWPQSFSQIANALVMAVYPQQTCALLIDLVYVDHNGEPVT